MSDRTESQHPPRIVYLTAGAAGMYCGSCMHDNALAKSLRRRGIDCVLQPVYTPIRTDEESVANQTVFFGGIQIYLLSRFGWLRRVPSGLRRWLDHPKVLRWATRKSRATDAAQLGDLAVSMLRGEHGDQVDEVARLTDWLADEVHPDVIVLTNLLIGGVLPTIRKRLPGVKVIVLLQGDDIFLDHLPAKQRKEAVALCAELTSLVDRFVVNSDFYAKKMLVLLGIDPSQIVIHPLTIDLQPFENASEVSGSAAEDGVGPVAKSDTEKPVFRLGYLARVSPEKGLHHLVDAFIALHATQTPDTLPADDRRDAGSLKLSADLAERLRDFRIELHVAGWLGEHNQPYFQELVDRMEAAGLSAQFVHHGSPDLDAKVQFLNSLDLLSVPTDYEDPKGLFILESLAAGVPVIQPRHGAFGELVSSTGGGVLYPPDDAEQFLTSLAELILDHERRHSLAKAGREAVRDRHHIDAAADRILHTITAIDRPMSTNQ